MYNKEDKYNIDEIISSKSDKEDNILDDEKYVINGIEDDIKGNGNKFIWSEIGQIVHSNRKPQYSLSSILRRTNLFDDIDLDDNLSVSNKTGNEINLRMNNIDLENNGRKEFNRRSRTIELLQVTDIIKNVHKEEVKIYLDEIAMLRSQILNMNKDNCLHIFDEEADIHNLVNKNGSLDVDSSELTIEKLFAINILECNNIRRFGMIKLDNIEITSDKEWLNMNIEDLEKNEYINKIENLNLKIQKELDIKNNEFVRLNREFVQQRNLLLKEAEYSNEYQNKIRELKDQIDNILKNNSDMEEYYLNKLKICEEENDLLNKKVMELKDQIDNTLNNNSNKEEYYLNKLKTYEEENDSLNKKMVELKDQMENILNNNVDKEYYLNKLKTYEEENDLLNKKTIELKNQMESILNNNSNKEEYYLNKLKTYKEENDSLNKKIVELKDQMENILNNNLDKEYYLDKLKTYEEENDLLNKKIKELNLNKLYLDNFLDEVMSFIDSNIKNKCIKNINFLRFLNLYSQNKYICNNYSKFCDLFMSIDDIINLINKKEEIEDISMRDNYSQTNIERNNFNRQNINNIFIQSICDFQNYYSQEVPIKSSIIENNKRELFNHIFNDRNSDYVSSVTNTRLKNEINVLKNQLDASKQKFKLKDLENKKLIQEISYLKNKIIRNKSHNSSIYNHHFEFENSENSFKNLKYNKLSKSRSYSNIDRTSTDNNWDEIFSVIQQLKGP